MTKTVAFSTPVYSTVRSEKRGTVQLTPAIKSAMKDWLSGNACWSQRWPTSRGRYCLRVAHPTVIGGKKLVTAKWNTAAKAAFASTDELHHAAHTARFAGHV